MSYLSELFSKVFHFGSKPQTTAEVLEQLRYVSPAERKKYWQMMKRVNWLLLPAQM